MAIELEMIEAASSIAAADGLGNLEAVEMLETEIYYLTWSPEEALRLVAIARAARRRRHNLEALDGREKDVVC